MIYHREVTLFFFLILCVFTGYGQEEGYRLVFFDEFNIDGPPDTSNWRFEKGFVRNHEAQWYQEENAYCADGNLVIEAKRVHLKNPNYKQGSRDWKTNREFIDYTSSSINTAGKKSWKYGRFEMRAKIDVSAGLWPAFWTLGVQQEWPRNGEIDIMEYYRGDILANVATGTEKRFVARWYAKKKKVNTFDEDWGERFHVWRMDWDSLEIKLYVDDLLLNRVPLDSLYNPDGSNPFRQPHYILVNMAIGGDNGGDPSETDFPKKYIIDYIRVYQKE